MTSFAATIRVMKLSRTTTALAIAAAVSLGVAAGPAGAATTQIGAVDEIGAGAAPSPIAAGGSVVQVAEATGSYAVPAGFGMITAWSHSAGTVAGPLTFKVYRPTGAPQQFVAVASDTRTITASSVQSFPVQIPVRPGDRIGLSSEDVQLAYETFSLGDQLGFFSADPPVGATRATDGDPFSEFKLDVTATLESDPGGSGPGAPPSGMPSPGSPPPGVLPAVTLLRVAPSAFTAALGGPSALAVKRARTGATVTYRLNVAAMVRFTVQQSRTGRRTGTGASARCRAETRGNRSAPRCIRMATLPGSFTRTSRVAGNRFSITGRLGGRTLKPGAYTLVATPRSGGRIGRPVRSRLRIVR